MRPSSTKPFAFWPLALAVLRSFQRNQGLLLAGAVAYYTLLAVVPLFVLVLVALSHVADTAHLLGTLRAHLAQILPAHADELSAQVGAVLEARDVIGGVGLLVLVFFSAAAFAALERAMAVIFAHRADGARRHYAVSAVIPFLFMCLLGTGLLIGTLLSGALEAIGPHTLEWFGLGFSPGGLQRVALQVLAVVGLVGIFTAVYLVMPVGGIAFRHALVGGITAALLWEICRRVLIWYFATLSMVSVVYGSLASAVVVLLSLEIGAIVVLLGGQVIAELELRRRAVPADSGTHPLAARSTKRRRQTQPAQSASVRSPGRASHPEPETRAS